MQDKYRNNALALTIDFGKDNNGRPYKLSVFGQHGAYGSGRKLGSAMSAAEDLDGIVANADLYVRAHTHSPVKGSRKVFTFNTLISANTLFELPTSIPDMDILINMKGIVYNNNNPFGSGRFAYPIPFNNAPGDSIYFGMKLNDRNINILSSGSWSNLWTKVIILDYTKTSD